MRHLFLYLFCFGFLISFSQSKKAEKLYNNARTEFKTNNIEKTIELLGKAIADSPTYMDAILFKADLHSRRNEKAEALSLYEEALKSGAPYYVNLFYGEILFETQDYPKAKKVLQRYLNSPGVTEKYLKKVSFLIKCCDFATHAMANPKEFNTANLGAQINTDQLEYFPSISADGLSLVFTQRRMEGPKTDEDFWITKRDSQNGSWNQANPLPGNLNTPLNEGAQSLSANGKVMFFTSCGRPGGHGSCDIYASFYNNQRGWSKPYNLGPDVNTSNWESQPSISPDGKTLYFTRGKSGESKNTDIYFTTLNTAGLWSRAQKIKGLVNTSGQEGAPFIHFDNRSLYFTSNGHPGMGKTDFFVSYRKKDGAWGAPINLGYPINTSANEFSLVVAPNGKMGFYASEKEEGGMGGMDLYSFDLPPESQAIEIAYVKGTVTNKKTKEYLSASLEFSDLANNDKKIRDVSDKSGKYFTVLPANSDYGLSIQKKGYLFYSKNFSLATQIAERAFELNVELQPIEVGQKVKLENVFFDSKSFELSAKSESELKSLAHFLKNNTTVVLLVEGHTDAVGSSKNNQLLSENRAKAVQQSLLAQGIDGKRIKIRGFGSEQPVATNETEEGRQLNRRTEIKILEY